MEKQLKELQEALEESDKAVAKAISERDSEIERLGTVSKTTMQKVADAEKAMLAATEEISSKVAELKKASDESLADVTRRVEEVEKRFGRVGPPSLGERVKSLGQQFVDMVKGDSDMLSALKRGSKGYHRGLTVDGPGFAAQMAVAAMLMKAAIPFSPDGFVEMLQKTTIQSSDATRLVAPMRDSFLPTLRRAASIRDYAQVRPTTSNAIEYIEMLGVGPSTASTNAITSMTSVASVATVNVTTAHGLNIGDIVELRGATETGYNGVWAVTEVVDTDSFKVQLATTPSASPATGSPVWRNYSLNGAAASVQEGSGAKPEARFQFELKTAIVQTLAHWVPATRQVLDDWTELQSLIDSELTYGVYEEEERQLLYGTGSNGQIQGILTHPLIQAFSQGSYTNLNALRRIVTLIQMARMSANLFVMNPLNWEEMETATSSTDEHYLLVGGAAGSEQRVWRVPVLATPRIAENTVLGGAFDMGLTIYDRQQTSVRFSEHHASFFVENLLAVLAEERLASAVKRPRGFVKLTLT